jgi:hypothetical protein
MCLHSDGLTEKAEPVENPFLDAINKSVKRQFFEILRENVSAALENTGIRAIKAYRRYLNQGEISTVNFNAMRNPFYPPEFYLSVSTTTMCPKTLVDAILEKEKAFVEQLSKTIDLDAYIGSISLRPINGGYTFDIVETETLNGNISTPNGGLFFSEVLSICFTPKIQRVHIVLDESGKMDYCELGKD